MNIALYFLIVCFIVIIALLFSVLFYRPDLSGLKDVEPISPSVENKEYAFQENHRQQEILDSISIRWPDLYVMMENVSNDHVLVLRWKGMVQEEKILLFHVQDRANFQSLFEAMSRISEANLPMKYRILISFADTVQTQQDLQQLSYIVHGYHTEIHAAITDGDGILEGADHDLLCISCGCFSEMTLKLQGKDITNWLESLKPEELAKPIASDPQDIKKLMKDMNFLMELQYHFYRQRFIDNFVLLNPSFVSQFYPEIAYENEMLSFTAVNDSQMEEVLTSLRSSAAQYGISIKIQNETGTVPVPSFSQIDQEIEQACKNCSQRLEGVRILKKRDEFTLIPGVTTRGVSPIKQNHPQAEEQVLFYQTLIQ